MNDTIHIRWTFQENSKEKKQLIVDMVDFVFQHEDIPSPYIIHITDDDPILVKYFDKNLLTKLVEENDYSIEYENNDDSFGVVMSLINPDGISVFFSKDLLNIWKGFNLFSFVKKMTLFNSSTSCVSCRFSGRAKYMHRNYYIYNRRTFHSPGLVWLQYYAHEELARQGGKEAIKQNPYIQYEEIGEGILVQVGDSPYDAYTKEGEELLVKATKAMPPVVEV